MKVLICAAEGLPFSKTGGLADVIGALPNALSEEGVVVDVVLPLYKKTKDKFIDSMELISTSSVYIDHKDTYVGYYKLTKDNYNVYFVDNDYYFGYREGLYGYDDEVLRFGFFNKAIIHLMEQLNNDYDLVHLNDWQTGLLPHYLKKHHTLYNTKILYTIHNIQYQGNFDLDRLNDLHDEFDSCLEFDGRLNFMKTAIVLSDYVSTVSNTYAKEILDPYFGYGMNYVLQDKQDRLTGIVNGIDYSVFSPKVDDVIEKKFTLRNYKVGKNANIKALKKEFHLEDNDRPVFGVVSRLTDQKGFNLLQEVIEPFLHQDIQLVILGSGDQYYEDYFNYLQSKYPTQVGVYIGYSDDIARKVYAGSDFFLMPSRFEPCGLSQLIALKYGSIPVVHKTGGLKDTIEIYNKYEKTGFGFGFDQFSSYELQQAITKGLQVYNNKTAWYKVVREALNQDFSWKQSALKYISLYKEIMEGK